MYFISLCEPSACLLVWIIALWEQAPCGTPRVAWISWGSQKSSSVRCGKYFWVKCSCHRAIRYYQCVEWSPIWNETQERRSPERVPYRWCRVVAGSGGTQPWLMAFRARIMRAACRHRRPRRCATSTNRAPLTATPAFHYILATAVQPFNLFTNIAGAVSAY